MLAGKIVSLVKKKKNLPAECSELLALLDDRNDDGVSSSNGNEVSQSNKLAIHSVSLNC